jgi:ribosomal protein L4
MGRKRKFGEESDFVSVRVPKSKKKEYRIAIKNFVEEKFAKESSFIDETSKMKSNKRGTDGFRKFEEFLKELKE